MSYIWPRSNIATAPVNYFVPAPTNAIQLQTNNTAAVASYIPLQTWNDGNFVNQIWIDYSMANEIIVKYISGNTAAYIPHIETPEEKLAREKREAEIYRAREKGKKLLKDFLSDAEFAALYDKGIWIPSKMHRDKDRKYLVKPDTQDGTVRVYENGKDVGWLCVHLADKEFVQEDVILARLLMLEFDEEKLLAVANFHAG